MGKKKKPKSGAGARGKLREIHFADGGSLAEWRGSHKVHKSKKDKRAGNRSQRNKKAAEDSSS